jgi:hypothetical protein
MPGAKVLGSGLAGPVMNLWRQIDIATVSTCKEYKNHALTNFYDLRKRFD